MLGLIVACARNRVIGQNGRIPWRIRGEQRRFKELTTGNIVIMGRRTYDEIGRPLPDRDTIVVTSRPLEPAAHLQTATSLAEALRLAESMCQPGNRAIYVAGGERLFAEAIPLADVLIITRLDQDFAGDTFFPEFDATPFDCQILERVEGDIPYTVYQYTRKRGGTPMQELELKYGCNPNQKPARVLTGAGKLPFTVENGRPGYINLLDALNGWQLVRELRRATGLPAAASFKHVSPAGAAVAQPLDDVARAMYFCTDRDLSPLATAYVRARGADRMCSFGDFAALSDPCDAATARILAREVSDGVIAPGYSPEALEILRAKRKGTYVVLTIDPAWQPAAAERKDVFGVTFEQQRNEIVIDETCLTNIVTANRDLPESARRDLLIALITLKYTQSNSVCYVLDGQTIGVGAGQQSRIHCTRLAGDKADVWHLRRHPQVLALPFRSSVKRPDRDNAIDNYITGEDPHLLDDDRWPLLFTRRPDPLPAEQKDAWLAQLTDVALASDAFFPFGDNIERAVRSGVRYVAQTGGSLRDDLVIEACDRFGVTMAMTGIRLFHH